MRKRPSDSKFAQLALGLVFGLAGAASWAAGPTGSGPEPATVYGDESLPTHTIYRPEELDGQ